MKTYTIKPLVWYEVGGDLWSHTIGVMSYRASCNEWGRGNGTFWESRPSKSLAAAKAAAEAHWFAFVEQALQEVTE